MSEQDFSETRVSSKTVYEGKLLTVREDIVQLPDGGKAKREYVCHSGAAMILPMLSSDTILLERQYRYPVQHHVYELPAGKVDPGEDPFVTAQRELLEETGYQAKQWRHLTTLHPCVGYSDEKVELYLASDMSYTALALDEGEFLETLEISLEEALAWVKCQKITEVKTILGLFWAEKIIKNGW